MNVFIDFNILFLEGLDFLEVLDSLDFLDFLEGDVVGGEEGAEALVLGREGLQLVAQLLDFLLLGGAAVESRCRHALADAPALDELFFSALLVVHEHGVYHVAQGEGGVGRFLVGPSLEIGLVVLEQVAFSAEGEHRAVTWVQLVPDLYILLDEVVLIVLLQFLYAGPCHVEQLEFQLHGCHSVGTPLNDVLLS